MSSPRTVEVSVTGMHCANCAQTIDKKLRSTAGVSDAVVNFANQSARVTFDPSSISPDIIERQIMRAGYGVALTAVTLTIAGMQSDIGARKIRTAIERVPGVFSVIVNLVNEEALVRINPQLVTGEDLKAAIITAGFRVESLITNQDGGRSVEEQFHWEQHMRMVRIVIAFAVSLPLMMRMMISPHQLSPYVVLIISMPVFLFVSMPIFRAAFIALRSRNLTMDVMYTLGISTAFGASVLSTFGILGSHEFMLYDTAIMLAGFLTLGRFLEARARGKTGDSINKLIGLQAKTATIDDNGTLSTIPIEEVAPGQIIVVKPGDKIPVDGEVTEGSGTVDEAMITGEPIPAVKRPGSRVVGGTINRSSVLRFKAQRVGRETMLANIIRMVREAQGSRPPLQRIADAAVILFIPAVLAVALLTFFSWYFFAGSSLQFALTTTIAVLVIACPCALGLASPTAVTVGIGRGAELGILIKNGGVLEKSKSINTVVFDKTGTLTNGKLTVAAVKTVRGRDNELLRRAAALEVNSRHPIGEAIVQEAQKRKCKIPPCSSFVSIDGKGVAGQIDGRRVALGNRTLMDDEKIDVASVAAQAETFEQQGMTAVFLAEAGTITGCIGMADTLKTTALQAVVVLTAMGIKCVMLSGDNLRSVEAIGRQLGIAEFRAEVLPQDKAMEVKKLQQAGNKVAFVGDGINDAPALAQADVGIALGSGTDIAMESGEIILVKGDPIDVATALQLGRIVNARIRGNLFWAFAYNTALIPLAAGVLYPVWHIIFQPELAGLAMALSSVTVVSRSLMIRRFVPVNKWIAGT